MKIATNVPALHTYNAMASADKRLAKSSAKLSTGKKILKASDNPSASAIGKKLSNQTNGTKIASDNSSNGIALIQTAEGALDQIHAMIQRMRELSVQASNGTLDDVSEGDHAKIQMEVDQLTEEIDAIINKTEYNNIKLLSGEVGDTYVGKFGDTNQGDSRKGLSVQVGANQNMELSIVIASIKTKDIFSSVANEIPIINVSTQENAQKAISICDEGLLYVSEARAKLGAYQNRLEFTVLSLDNASEQMERSLSLIRDTDMAEEMIEYSKNNVIAQAGISILAQANQRPQMLLQLIGR